MIRASRGFTLVEVLVVLAILGSIAAVTVPAFRDITRSDALHDGAEAVTHLLERARMTARTAGHSVTVTIDPASAQYWVDEPALTGTIELPRNATLFSRERRARFSFDASGTASADALGVLVNGQAITVEVDRLTSAIVAHAR